VISNITNNTIYNRPTTVINKPSIINRPSVINRPIGVNPLPAPIARPWVGNHTHWHSGCWSGWNTYPSFWQQPVVGLTPSVVAPVVYANPYVPPPPTSTTVVVTPPPPAALDYSQPIQVPSEAQVARTDQDVVDSAMVMFDRARSAFKRGMYATAQSEVECAIRLLPGDPMLHEFRGLCQFAREDFQNAASTIYALLNVGPGSDWQTILALYPDQDTYSKQLRKLEKSIREGGNEPWRHFLLGYHYLVLDEREAALAEFRESSRLNSKDTVSRALVTALEKDSGRDATKPGEG
jgi:tetratricopeptide (TPR) repeat protein